jgi:hypothetical protein
VEKLPVTIQSYTGWLTWSHWVVSDCENRYLGDFESRPQDVLMRGSRRNPPHDPILCASRVAPSNFVSHPFPFRILHHRSLISAEIRERSLTEVPDTSNDGASDYDWPIRMPCIYISVVKFAFTIQCYIVRRIDIAVTDSFFDEK